MGQSRDSMGLVPPWDSNSHGTRTPPPGTPIATPRRDSHSYTHCHATPGSRHHALSSLRKNSSWESQVLWDSPRHGTVPGLHGSRHAALPGRVPLSHSCSRDSDSSTPGTSPTVPLVLPGLEPQPSRDESHSYSRDSDSSTPGTSPTRTPGTRTPALPGLGPQHPRDEP